MTFKIELEQEDDGRWLAEVLELPGVMAYGDTPDEAKSKVQALALRVVADRLEEDVKKLVETVMSDSWSFPDSRP